MTTPFVVFGLPRSRTAWLSSFLSYKDWSCGHDELRHARSMDDVKSWLGQPNTGTVETLAAPFWRTLRKLSPEARVVVVRRPLPEVLDSLQRTGMPFDYATMARSMGRLDRKLEQIEERWPGAVRVSFADLATEEACAHVFEHCLPYPHDPQWWAHMATRNVQINFPAMVRYVQAFKPQMDKLAGQARWLELSELAKRSLAEPDELAIAEESFASFYEDGKKLFKDHMVQTGQAVDDYQTKNLELFDLFDKAGILQVVTARCNGRMFGYLASVIGPSFDDPGLKIAENLMFFASPEFKGLGRKLQWAAKEGLRRRGVDHLFLRAGTRGDGPRMGSLYRRMGAEDHGQLFRLHLKD